MLEPRCSPSLFLDQFFDFGGNGEPSIPIYNIVHTQRGRHPIYNVLEIAPDLLVTQQSSALELGENSLTLASSTIGGDDTKFGADDIDKEIADLAKQASALPNSKQRTKILNRIKELRRKKASRAHGADKGHKLSIIPIVPEAPLSGGAAAEGAADFEFGSEIWTILETLGLVGAL